MGLILRQASLGDVHTVVCDSGFAGSSAKAGEGRCPFLVSPADLIPSTLVPQALSTVARGHNPLFKMLDHSPTFGAGR